MKQRPILFSTPMVQAILEGRKTQTRRIIKKQPKSGEQYGKATVLDGTSDKVWTIGLPGSSYVDIINCPYGKPGDVLWVRETFGNLKVKFGYYMYKADDLNISEEAIKKTLFQNRWKPSIHMPKAAARIYLKITQIRMERLNDISEEDAISEGVPSRLIPPFNAFSKPRTSYFDYQCKTFPSMHIFNAKDSFKSLWQSINGFNSWTLNDWVWVVSFERIDKPE